MREPGSGPEDITPKDIAPEDIAPEDIATVHIEHLGAVVVVEMAGEIDAATDAIFSEPLFACLDEHPRALVIDLKRIGFIGSTGLNILVEAYRQACRDGIGLCVVASTRAVRRPLEISGLDTYLPVSRSVPDALIAIGMARNADADRQ